MQMDFTETMRALTPDTPSDPIAWDALETRFGVFFSAMRETQQNPVYHAEGDVFIHTRNVCGALRDMPAFHALPALRKTELFTAALLHDIGKIETTRMENGAWTSPNHAEVGSRMARAFLWQECGMCGTPEKMRFRETVCALIRYHMQPAYLGMRKKTERKAREIAVLGELLPDFSWDVLCLLSEADGRGRIAEDSGKDLRILQTCRALTEQAGCLTGPFAFENAYAKRAYFSGRNVPTDRTLSDNTWGEVILTSGLPGTGKDAWICANVPQLPTVSPDEIRGELHVPPDKTGDDAIRAAQTRARAYLRKKQPFVWNATSLTKEIRKDLIRMFEQCGARVRIVYLETDLDERRKRIRSGEDAVPQDAAESMLSVLIPPTPDEAQTVEWVAT